MVGTSAKWVPDDPPPSAPANMASVPPPQASPTNDPAYSSSSFDFVSTTAATTEPPAEISSVAVPNSDPSVATHVRSRRRRRGNRTPVIVGITTAIVMFAAVGYWFHLEGIRKAQNEVAASESQPPQKNAAWEADRAELERSDQNAQSLSPTSGNPIPLDYIAFTPHLILHLRPQEIAQHQKFNALLFNLGLWMDASIREITQVDPANIEELTIAVNFGPRTTPPEVAAVVRLNDEQIGIALARDRFHGQVRIDVQAERPGDIYESGDFCYMEIDAKTFAVASSSSVEGLVSARKYPPIPDVDLEPLLRESDRKRHISVMFNVGNIDVHRKYIFIEQMQFFADTFVQWFGKDVQTVSWSAHLEPNLFMETLLHQTNESSPLRVRRHIDSQLQKLPEQILTTVRYMQPAEVGSRRIIGQFPVMMKALTMGTTSHVGPTYVRLTTLLPRHASENLAAGSLLTWNQSVHTDFTQESRAIADTSALPQTVADRLKMKVFIDFRRTPLQEAFAYISEEIKTPIDINGDALKLSGFTQNMAQTFNLGDIPAVDAIDAILKQYEGKMVISVDETSRSITVTTRPVALEQGVPIFETSQ